MVLLIMSVRCFASGYYGDMGDAWRRASIVVLGRPQIVPTPGKPSWEEKRGLYAMGIQRAYKGAKPEGKIEFIDPYFHSTAGLNIQEGERLLVFIQTESDRGKEHEPATEGIGKALSGIRVFQVTDKNLTEIEAGIATVKTYETLAPQDQKAFLLQNLTVTNAYAHTLIVREILHAGIKEAIPYFQKKLSQATDEGDKLSLIGCLQSLGDPSVKATLLSWLSDDSFQRKWELIEETLRLNDKSLVPAIRKFIDAQDDIVAVTARIGLLRLGDPDGKRLLFDMIKKSNDPTARYNAIHTLNWNYSGDFTDKEKEIIRNLVKDKDPTIARVAGFIVKKWNSSSNKPSEATSQ